MGFEAKLVLYKNIRIKVLTNSPDYMKAMKKAFTHKVKGYFWSPKYRAGIWNGKSSLITKTGTFPFGLLPDYLRIHKENHKDVKLKVDDSVTAMFKGDDIEIKFDMSLMPRPYQKESIEYCLKYTKGIIRSATASGKSLAISYIIKNLLDNKYAKSAIVIVPSKQLVEQFYMDMQEYGIKEKYIGRIYDKIKNKPEQWSRAIVITTWQSLKNNTDRLPDYDIIIGDECHQVKAHELKKIFSKSPAKYRFGFTGTMPTDPLEILNTKAFIGPVLRDYPSGLLGEQGYIAKCNVKVLNIDYGFGLEAEYYDEIKRETFEHKFRLGLIKDLVEHLDHNVLLLVGLHKEGKLLQSLLQRSNKEAMFLCGSDSVSLREEWRQRMIDETNIALVATYGIFQQGINIPSLKYLILAAPFKSKIRVLQSIGRTLRQHEDKSDGAFVFDIVDDVRYLRSHGNKRILFYESEGFNIEEFEFDTMKTYDLNQYFPSTISS
jgi:superfamily II DNA or RNA helicase